MENFYVQKKELNPQTPRNLGLKSPWSTVERQKKQDFGAINFFTLKMGNDIVAFNIKLQYIHARKEDLAQGKKKN